jgi:hypothetical protein
VNRANKETERTTSGEEKGSANEHSIVEGKKVPWGRGKARRE